MAKITLLSLGFVFGVFHLGTAYFGTLVGQQQQAVHLLLAIMIGGTSLAMRSADWWARGFALLIALLGAVPTAYVIYLDRTRGGMVATFPEGVEIVMAIALWTCLVVMTQRLMGWALPAVMIAFTLFPFIGHLVTPFQDEPFSTSQLVFQVYSYTEGIFGVPLTVAATFVAVFLLYGALLERTGGGQFFLDLSIALFGRVRGGPAKVAVVASGLFGSINGSAVANVASTGSLTIPLMKKIGLRPHYAAAVETAASSGGQLMPPIMGAAAFIMAQLIGEPYRLVVIAATIPAVLYFWALIVDIDLEAGRLNMASLDSSEMPSIGKTLWNGWPHLVSPAYLVYSLVIAGRSPMFSGLWSVVVMLVVTLVKRSTRWNPKVLLEGFEAGARSAVSVALATAAAGVVIASLNLTGLGLRLSGLLVDASGGNLFILLLMTMVACIILGLGLPTVAAYLILAVTIAPALIALDVAPIAAHLFIFYYGVMSASTPPVALAAFAASGIAGSDPMRTAFTSVRLGWIAFIIPFLFVYEPVLLASGDVLSITFAVVSALIAVVAVVSAAQGHLFTTLSLPFRAANLVGGLLLLVPGVLGDAPGYVIVVVVAAINYLARRKAKATLQPSEGTSSDASDAGEVQSMSTDTLPAETADDRPE